MNAVDTNIIAYLFDPTARVKQARAQQLLDELVEEPSETVWLWQVAIEFLACLRKAANKGLVPKEEVPGNFRELLQLFTLMLPSAPPLHQGVALVGLMTHARSGLRRWRGVRCTLPNLTETPVNGSAFLRRGQQRIYRGQSFELRYLALDHVRGNKNIHFPLSQQINRDRQVECVSRS